MILSDAGVIILFFIGIDLGGTAIKAGVVTPEGIIVAKSQRATGAGRNHAEIVRDMAETALEAVRKADAGIEEIKSVGIGSPGTVDKSKGSIVYANNINMRNAAVCEELRKYIRKPVFIENDANCAALGESAAGASRGAKHSVMITLGTGIGSGVMIGGELYRGFNGAGAELGHMVIVSGGVECTCGRKGCWESYASGSALVRETIKAAKKDPGSKINILTCNNTSPVNAKTAFDAAKMGDKTAKKVVDDFIMYLGEGITNIINSFQPEVIVIGGGISNEGEYLLGPLREYADKHRYTREEIPSAVIKKALLGNDAGIIGAALIKD